MFTSAMCTVALFPKKNKSVDYKCVLLLKVILLKFKSTVAYRGCQHMH